MPHTDVIIIPYMYTILILFISATTFRQLVAYCVIKNLIKLQLQTAEASNSNMWLTWALFSAQTSFLKAHHTESENQKSKNLLNATLLVWSSATILKLKIDLFIYFILYLFISLLYSSLSHTTISLGEIFFVICAPTCLKKDWQQKMNLQVKATGHFFFQSNPIMQSDKCTKQQH